MDVLFMGSFSALHLPDGGSLTTIGTDAQQANTAASYSAKVDRSSVTSSFTNPAIPVLTYDDPSDGGLAWGSRTFRNGDGTPVSEAQITVLGAITAIGP